MAESKSHIDLVAVAIKYTKTLVSSELYAMIQCDSADFTRPTKAIENFIPDVYFWHDKHLIIGEAKTLEDFERPHSRKQFEAYIKECKNFYGEATLIISVPWQLVATAKNYFRRLKRELQSDSTVIVLDETGRPFKL